MLIYSLSQESMHIIQYQIKTPPIFLAIGHTSTFLVHFYYYSIHIIYSLNPFKCVQCICFTLFLTFSSELSIYFIQCHNLEFKKEEPV